MWNNIKSFLLYAGLEPYQYEKVASLVTTENRLSLRLASIVQALYFGASLISSMNLSSMANKRLVYGIGTVIPLGILVVYVLFSTKHPSIIPWLVRIFCIGIYAAGLLCTLVCTPGEMTILLLIFFFCVPMIFIAPPIELYALVILTDIVYFSAAMILKSSDVLLMDMIDVLTFSTLSLILGGANLKERYRRNWLETSAVDLAEIRYQAAFIDPLTGCLNRNAYNKETECLEKSGIPKDFMFMTLDINGLKTANDTFGHVAGDELIRGAAECMTKSFSKYGSVYRVGGDEFNILLKTNGVPEGVILKEFKQTTDEWSGSLVSHLTVSFGVVMQPEAKGMTFHEIELLADKRMYQAKADYYKNAGIDRRRH